MTPCHTTIDSPVGPLTLVARDGSLTGLYMHEQRHRPQPETFGVRDDGAEPFATATRQLAEYFAGTRTAFDLPLAPAGTPFQQRVWAALREIPYGETTSYGELAERIGSPGAARAVGRACASNPVALVIPCHRAVRGDGAHGGYRWGAERKQRILETEVRECESAGVRECSSGSREA